MEYFLLFRLVSQLVKERACYLNLILLSFYPHSGSPSGPCLSGQGYGAGAAVAVCPGSALRYRYFQTLGIYGDIEGVHIASEEQILVRRPR